MVQTPEIHEPSTADSLNTDSLLLVTDSSETPLPPEGDDPVKPEIKPLPENGDAQKIVAAYCREAKLDEPADYGRAVGIAARIAKAGIGASDIPALFGFVASWSDGPDLQLLFNSIDKWRAGKNLSPKNGRASPQVAYANGAPPVDSPDFPAWERQFRIDQGIDKPGNQP